MDSNESDIPAEEYIAPQHEAEENDTETIPPPSAANNSSASVIEFEPPLASIKRLLKQTLPANTIISKDALSAITRACGIFIIYITACANDCARENKRSTISANDILSAIKEVEFDEFTPSLQIFLDKLRENQKAKKESKKNSSVNVQENGKPIVKILNDTLTSLDNEHVEIEENQFKSVNNDDGQDNQETLDESFEMDPVIKDDDDDSTAGNKRQRIEE